MARPQLEGETRRTRFRRRDAVGLVLMRSKEPTLRVTCMTCGHRGVPVTERNRYRTGSILIYRRRSVIVTSVESNHVNPVGGDVNFRLNFKILSLNFRVLNLNFKVLNPNFKSKLDFLKH